MLRELVYLCLTILGEYELSQVFVMLLF